MRGVFAVITYPYSSRNLQSKNVLSWTNVPKKLRKYVNLVYFTQKA